MCDIFESPQTCSEKVSKLNPINNQVIYLTTQYSLSGCTIQTVDHEDKYVCTGGRRFSSARERWWYITVSRCDRANNSVSFTNFIQGMYTPCCVTVSSAWERWWYIAISRCDRASNCVNVTKLCTVYVNPMLCHSQFILRFHYLFLTTELYRTGAGHGSEQ